MTPFDKLPPQNPQAEKCLLGALLLAGFDNPVAWAEAMQQITRADFYVNEHALVFDAVTAVQKAGRPVDGQTVMAEMRQRSTFEQVGGTAFLSELLNAVPSASHAAQYAKIVRDMSVGRSMLRLAESAMRDVFNPMGRSYADLVASNAAAFSELATNGTPHAIRRLGEEAMDWYEEAQSGKPAPLLLTGFLEIDDVIGGMPIGGFTQIGGRPGMGKSALGKVIALNLASAGTPVGIVSIEETGRKIATNAVSNVGGIESWRIQRGKLASEDMTRALEGVNKLYNWPLFIADYPVKLADVETAIAMLVQKYGCRCVFVDHLHLIAGDEASNRTQEVTKISAALKATAKRLQIALVAMCQLNRASNRSEYMDRPTLREWRDSGALEQDGDVIMAVFREDEVRKQLKKDEPYDGKMEVHVLKNKYGRCGEIPLAWDGDYQSLRNWQGSPQMLACPI